ncbi:MAG: amino acid permease, partial [bacterium]|nr:amino acid permease [bacterium]
MQTSKKKSGGYIGLFSLVMINIVLVANLRFVPHISNVTFYTVFVSILAGLFFFFPICMIVAELYPIWSERGGVYHWVTKAFNDKVGFVAVFLQWGVVLLLTLLLLGFATTCFAFVFTPTIEDGISLASNKYYIVLSIIVFNWIIIFINKKGLHLTKKFSVIGTIFGILIPLLTLIFLTFI